MTMTNIIDTKTKNVMTFSLEPELALIACHEQVLRRNFSTWTYKTPTSYPIEKTADGMKLGRLKVLNTSN